MGIRIKKALGYGITIPKSQISTLLNTDKVEQRYELTSENYFNFLQQKYGKLETYVQNLSNVTEINDDYLLWNSVTEVQNLNAWNFITAVSANNDENVTDKSDLHIAITPVGCIKDWHHYDDAIDYYEAAYDANGNEFNTKPSIKFLPQGLHPYNGTYMNQITGKVVDYTTYRTVMQLVQVEDKLQSDTSDKDESLADFLSPLFSQLGVANTAEFKEHIHPAAPLCVKDLAEWSGIFKDKETIKELRPALITYWS